MNNIVPPTIKKETGKRKKKDSVLARKLPLLRKQKNDISQSDLAKKLKISQSRVARIESGADPYASEIIAMSDFFGLTIYELLELPIPKNESDMPKELQALYSDLKYIFTEGSPNIKQALTSNIREFKESALKDGRAAEQDARISKLETEFENYKKTHSPGPSSGTPEEPVGSTGS